MQKQSTYFICTALVTLKINVTTNKTLRYIIICRHTDPEANISIDTFEKQSNRLSSPIRLATSRATNVRGTLIKGRHYCDPLLLIVEILHPGNWRFHRETDTVLNNVLS